MVNNTKKLKDLRQMDIQTLRSGFAMYCKLLGLRKSTCIALTMLLDDKELLLAIMYFMAQIYDIRENNNEDVDKDITTIVVNVAEELREIWDKRNKI